MNQWKRDYVKNAEGSECPRIYEAGGDEVVRFTRYDGKAERQANLILAAPDLLAACEHTAGVIQRLIDSGFPSLPQELVILNAAIAKAKGEETS